MSDEKEEQKVVSLADFKNEKELEAGAELHEHGGAFMFEHFEIDDGELPNGVGFTDCEQHPICVLLNKEELTGISMSLETSERLANDLLDAVKEVRAHRAAAEAAPKEGA